MIPQKFDQFLGPYEPVVFDDTIAIGFGHRIIGSLGEELWQELGQYCKQHFDVENRYWVAVTRVLTREEAILTYGPITAEEYGPRGGWRSVTFGTTRFTSKLMAPAEVQNRPKKSRAKPKAKLSEHTEKEVLDAFAEMYGEKK